MYRWIVCLLIWVPSFGQLTSAQWQNHCFQNKLIAHSPIQVGECLVADASLGSDLIRSVAHYSEAPQQSWLLENGILLKFAKPQFQFVNFDLKWKKSLRFPFIGANTQLLKLTDSIQMWKASNKYVLTYKMSAVVWEGGFTDSLLWIESTPNGHIYVATVKQVFRFGKSGLEQIFKNSVSGNCTLLRSNHVLSEVDYKTSLWFGCGERDLSFYHLASGKMETYKHFPIRIEGIVLKGSGGLIYNKKSLYYFSNLQSTETWSQSVNDVILSASFWKRQLWLLTQKSLLIFDQYTGKKLYEVAWRNSDLAWLIVGNEQVVVVRKSGQVFAFNEKFSEKWNYKINEVLTTEPRVRHDYLLLNSRSTTVVLNIKNKSPSLKIKAKEKGLYDLIEKNKINKLPLDTQNKELKQYAKNIIWFEPGNRLALQVLQGQIQKTITKENVSVIKYRTKSLAPIPIDLYKKLPVDAQLASAKIVGQDVIVLGYHCIYKWSKIKKTLEKWPIPFVPKQFVVSHQMLIVSSFNGICLGMLRSNGQNVWVMPAASSQMMIASDENHSYFWMLSMSSLVRVDAQRGEVVAEILIPQKRWQHIVSLENSVLLISADGVVVSLDLGLNSLQFSRSMYAPITQILKVPQGVVLGINNQSWIKLNEQTGAISWSWMGKSALGKITTDGRWLYVSQGSSVSALSLMSGKPVGEVNVNNLVKGVANLRILGLKWSENLLNVDLNNGERISIDKQAFLNR